MQHNWQDGSPFSSLRITWLSESPAERQSFENLTAAARKLREIGHDFDDCIVDAGWNAWIEQQTEATIAKRPEPGDQQVVCRHTETRSIEQWALDLQERITGQGE